MNKLTFIVASFLIYSNLAAQDELTSSTNLYNKDSYTKVVYREIKDFPKLFSGFTIELIHSEVPLSSNYPIFSQYGKIQVDKSDGYCYQFIADFEEEDAAKKYLQDIILPRVKSAKLFYYKDGIRSEVK